MKNRLFVGNLSWEATEESLTPLFEACGKVVSVKVIKDQFTGRSKGFGFVEMESEDGATRAIQELNDKPHLQRNMRVSHAQERSERPAGGGERRDFRSQGGNRGGNGGGNGGGGERGFRPRGGERERSY